MTYKENWRHKASYKSYTVRDKQKNFVYERMSVDNT
jgi:hypothetical protein